MNQYTCLVCDDEPVARRVIKTYIEQTPYLALAGECENGLEAIAFLQKTAVDLLFLDINMPILDGLNFLKTMKNRPKTILTTAYSEHALEAYDLDVADYLVKPVPFERFLRAVARATDQHVGPQPAEKQAPSSENEYLVVRFGRMIHRVRFSEILFLEAQANAIKIVTDGQTLRAYQTLSSLEAQLPPGIFIRTHRSFLVNRHRVTTIEGLSISFGEFGRVPISEPLRATVFRQLGFEDD